MIRGNELPIQPENKIFPHVVPPSPDTESDLLSWSKDMSRTMEDLTRQIVEKFNLHMDQTHPHPVGWPYLRVRRPRYYNATDSGTTVTVPASVGEPIYFLINKELLEVTDDLTCDLSGSGVGGLDTGSVAANTPYYLFGIKSSGVAALIASVTAPGSGGPTGYDEWTYIGAIPTREAAANFRAFQSENGFYLADKELETESHNGDTNYTGKTFASMPTTVLKSYFICLYAGANANAACTITGTNAGSADVLGVWRVTANAYDQSHGFVSIFESQKVYLKTSHAGNTAYGLLIGWQEDPTRWK